MLRELLPGEPEVAGLLALLLLTDARTHPLHQRTEHVHRFTMPTAETRAELDGRCSAVVAGTTAIPESATSDIAEAA